MKLVIAVVSIALQLSGHRNIAGIMTRDVITTVLREHIRRYP